MISSIAVLFLGAVAATAMPCENLTSVKFNNAVITNAVVVQESPQPPVYVGIGPGGVRTPGLPHNQSRLIARSRWSSNPQPIR